MRHGRPCVDSQNRIGLHQIADWIDSYNQSSIDLGYPAPEATINAIASCKAVVCSDLPRSIDSAAHLGRTQIALIDPMFREMSLPYLCCRSPKMSPMFWVTVFRLSWLMGFSRHGESLATSIQRANHATSVLISMAHAHNDLLMVGHGFLNRYIAKTLIASGWQGPKRPLSGYWATSIYYSPEINL